MIRAAVLSVCWVLAIWPALVSGEGRATAEVPANAQVAQSDAAELLTLIPLPPGSVQSVGEPAGDGAQLADPSLSLATPNLVDRHGWWTVPLTRAQTIAFITSHVPTGSSLSGSGNGGTGRIVRNGEPEVGNVESEWDEFSFPSVEGVLGHLSLLITAVQLPNGSSGVRADAQVVWVTPRPATEIIPSGARRLRLVALSEIHRNRSGQNPLTVGSVARIEAVVKLLNALPAEQPGARNCPVDFGNRVRLTFRSHRGSRPLAVVTIDPEGCGGVGVLIRGKVEHRLESGHGLVGQIGRIIGANINTAPRLRGGS